MISIFRRILLIFLLTFAPIAMMSQVKIRIEIENFEDSIFYLLKYKSDKSLAVIDASTISYKEKIFKATDNYPEGIYILADSKQNPLFEMLIGKDQKFSIKISDLMRNDTYIIKGSKETSAYFDIYNQTNYNQLYIKALESEIEYYPNNEAKIDSLKKNLLSYQESKMLKDENAFLNTYIKFIQDTDIKELPLCDLRILNSRLLKNKMDHYFDLILMSETDEYICERIDDLISRTNDCHEVRDYILWYLYSRYFNNDIIYTHLSDVYFSKLEINNLTENIRCEIVKRADILRKITIGRIAPTFTYIDDEGKQIDLSEIDSKNTILFFYKPDCQKCIRDKRILGLIKKRQKNLTILHINISEENYSNVSQNIAVQYDIKTTPTIYILDKDKRITAKNIKAEEIEFHIIKR